MPPLDNTELGNELPAEKEFDENAEQPELVEKPVKKGSGLQFGNLDKEKKHDLSKLKVPAGHVVVRHFNHVDLANGQKMEDPTTNRLQVYDVATFDNLSKQKTSKEGTQLASQFELLGLNTQVLHDPRK